MSRCDQITVSEAEVSRHGRPGEDLMDGMRRQAARRVAMPFVARRTASWDHRRLAETY